MLRGMSPGRTAKGCDALHGYINAGPLSNGRPISFLLLINHPAVRRDVRSCRDYPAAD